mgnify:CR=1 FL=1
MSWDLIFFNLGFRNKFVTLLPQTKLNNIMRVKILVVDDEESICEILKYNLEKEGYEADDVIGTLSRVGENSDLDVTILSGDRDNFQLITDKVVVK